MKKESIFIIGTSSLIIAIVLGIISPDLPLLSFLKGMFTGISIAMNIGFLIRYRFDEKQDN